MCLDAQTSWITLVIGTVLNIWNVWYYKDTTITSISLLWEWVLLMQFFEAIAWTNQPTSEGNCNSTNKWAAKGAYLANVSQPIVLAFVMFTFKGDELCFETKMTAAIVILMYTLWLLYATNYAPEVTCLTPKDDCGNLTYTWWQEFPGNAAFYLGTLVLLILVMVKPLEFAVMQLGYITLTFIVSAYFYSCGIGSMWCWFAAFAPLLTGFMWESRTSSS